MIDKELGNIIKLDRHSYVKVAYHGTRPMGKAERTKIYGASTQKDFSAGQFAPIDTLFSLPDAFMYSQLVTFIDDNRLRFPHLQKKTYKQVYADVRTAVDLCHRDGVIKDKVGLDPGQYIQAEPGIIDMLKRYRASGRKVFLVTNSLWDYTNVVMNHINGFSAESERNLDWLKYFDLVIVGACKPQFLENDRLPLFRVHPEDGLNRLSNMDNALFDPPKKTLGSGKVFQGGCFQHLHYLLGVQGDQLLYVGDHMFSDVIRGKRSLGWRTVLVIPELESEVDVALRELVRRKRIQELRELRDELDEWIDRLSLLLVSCERDENCALSEREIAIESEREKALEELGAVKAAFAEELRLYHESFHPVWGQMLKVGYQNSRFAQQVVQYACLYTSKVSNLGLVSPEMNFRTQLDFMPHDQVRA
jgi:HAD superfamily 5'-nucleotidase-like hydrolase